VSSERCLLHQSTQRNKIWINKFSIFHKRSINKNSEPKNGLYCLDSEDHFVDLKHYTGGSECHCLKCGLEIKFNRGWPERIEPKEMDEFLQKYHGSQIDF